MRSQARQDAQTGLGTQEIVKSRVELGYLLAPQQEGKMATAMLPPRQPGWVLGRQGIQVGRWATAHLKDAQDSAVDADQGKSATHT